jgi:HlyD family secretion protein
MFSSTREDATRLDLTIGAKAALLSHEHFMGPSKPHLDELRIERTETSPAGSKGWLIAVVVVLIAAAGATVWWRSRSNAIEVRTATAREVSSGGSGGDRTVLNASGYVTARRQATVSSKVTGKVVEVLIEEGMRVNKGQVVARLDDSNVKTGLAAAQAQFEAAQSFVEETRAQLKQADLDFRRTTELHKQKIASQADLDRAEADATSLRARLERQQRDVTVAERQVAIWQQQMDDMVIRAPFSGIVTTKDAQPGEMISPISGGGRFTRTGIGTIVDMDSLELEIDVNESSIHHVQPSQAVEATLDAYPAWKIPSKVIAVIPTADRNKQTVKVRIGFDKLDPRILPEMSVKAAFRETVTASPTAPRLVTVPKSVIREQEGRDVVFVVQNNRVERRAVTVNGTTGDDTVIGSGISAGERVVLDPKDLADGSRVKEIK